MNIEQRSQDAPADGQFIIITGETDQGQNIAAMRYIGEELRYGGIPFHNGCSNKGFRIRPETLANPSCFLELLAAAPDRSTFVIADADSCMAVIGEEPDADQGWYRLCQTKGHDVVLTTVRGFEHKIKGPLEDTATLHLYVAGMQEPPGLFIAASWGAMKERIPTSCWFLDEDRTISFAALTDGTYEGPTRPKDELIVSPIKSSITATDYSDAVRSTETPMPKHPENLMLLARTVRRDENRQEKTTEIITLPWLESVNKRRDEDMAVNVIEWTCERWGIDLTNIKMNPATTYPDAWAQHEGRNINLEVRKVQPKWPNCKTLAAMADIIRSGKAARPKEAPIIQCKQCDKPWDDRSITDVHTLPLHDSSHEWVCTYPARMIGPEWTGPLTALPNLLIKPGDLRTAVIEAVDDKDDRAKRFGKGKENWLILGIEGFPTDQSLHDELAGINWKSLDAVFLVLTSQFGSAIYQDEVDDNRIIAIARCPKADDHACYHPGVRTTIRKTGQEVQSLRENPMASGLVFQVVNLNGEVLAEEVREPELPVSENDVEKGIKRATKKLPFQPSERASDYGIIQTTQEANPYHG